MNLNYIRAAEQDIRDLSYLKRSLETLEKRKGIASSRAVDGSEMPAGDYVTEKQINEKLNSVLSVKEISREIRCVKEEIEMIEKTLGELPDEERKVLIMFYQNGMPADKIAEKLYRESEKTIYKIRNQGLYHYCLAYYGRRK